MVILIRAIMRLFNVIFNPCSIDRAVARVERYSFATCQLLQVLAIT